LVQAAEIFSQPKVFRRGGASNMAAKGPLREFGNDPASGKPVVAKDGKFGVYVTDGETNASLSKGDRLEAMPQERAYELLAMRREAIIEKGGLPAKKARATKKAATKKKAAPRKAPAKKAAGA
ncbi:MAG: topoisomerase C-terminal repeat-containing protein, partial [Ilumatobacteraceae bacterium]